MTLRPLAVLALAAALGGCSYAHSHGPAPAAAPVQYSGTPQEQWVQGNQAYLAWSGARPGWKTTPSGLQYHIVTKAKASAPKPEPGAVVTIHYVGTFIDGRKFDSSRDRGEPATFPLDRLIKGWQEGVPMMRKGETWDFVIPAELAYGDRNRDPIPNGSTLLFEIELIDIPAEG
jgi:FKBP-type peptidyl-prolyl cis-trans isomerase